MSRIYVTGVAGFLGSHLAEYLIAQGDEVLGCDDLSSGDARNVPYGVEWWEGDITDGLWTSEGMRGCDVVFHCAAAAYEGVSVFSPGFIGKNIYTGSANVFAAAIQAGVRRIVNCSSMARYGEATPPFAEFSPTLPVDPYGQAKLAAEGLLKILSKAHRIEYAIAVPHNIYGPRQNYWTPYRNVAAIMANRMLQGKQPIIYGDGLQQRSFSYIGDLVPALANMADYRCDIAPVVNLGPGDEERTTILSLARMLSDIIGGSFDPIFMLPRPCEVKYATCTDAIARGMLGFHAATPLRAGLEALVTWIIKRGPREFEYNLEIELEGAPRTWTERLI